ncbi:MAG: alpha/beta fold hydrolase [Planctomycetia bacterium]|nr:alpha/beta fold hydrolase [Planctomycetia bacterium]
MTFDPHAYELPRFRPHPLVRGGHAQTLAGVFFPGQLAAYRARTHRVPLADGDQIVVHDDCPDRWQPADPVALLMHGLGGCHQSVYMRRVAEKLSHRGVRAFRMDLRGCGAGVELARLPYHSGRSDDAAAVLGFLAALCPGSPVALVGFSLGGNIALKLVGECGAEPPGHLRSVVTVCPPVDLAASSRRIGQGTSRVYDRYFAELLRRQLENRERRAPHAKTVGFDRRPRRLREIDDWFTAPVCGFGTADNYYHQCSSARFVADIRLPALVVAAADDPLVPVAALRAAAWSASTVLHVTGHGGHLGFIGARSADPDRRWMDWRIVDWVMATTSSTREAHHGGTEKYDKMSKSNVCNSLAV